MTDLREAILRAESEISGHGDPDPTLTFERFQRYYRRRSQSRKLTASVLAIVVAVAGLSIAAKAFQKDQRRPASSPTPRTAWDTYHPRLFVAAGSSFDEEWIFSLQRSAAPEGRELCVYMMAHASGAGGFGGGGGCHRPNGPWSLEGSSLFDVWRADMGSVPQRVARVYRVGPSNTIIEGHIYSLPAELRHRFHFNVWVISSPIGTNGRGPVVFEDAAGNRIRPPR
jgi:hypothetical protein